MAIHFTVHCHLNGTHNLRVIIIIIIIIIIFIFIPQVVKKLDLKTITIVLPSGV